MTATEAYRVGVVVERRVAVSRWADHLWLPVGVLASPPDLPAWTPLGEHDGAERFFAGGFDLELHRTDTATYRDNLASGAPHVWIACRACVGEPPIEVVGVTADPAEGESYTEAGDDIVEQVAMPPELVEVLARFVAVHHVERQFVKRRRDGARRLEEDED
jgi:hypothetical protein